MVEALEESFRTGVTKTREWRMKNLQDLQRLMIEGKEELLQALKQDLHKSELEGYITENNLIENELQDAMDHLDQWMKPDRVSTDLLNIPASSYIIPDPYGVALIMGAWNYPVQLSIMPLVGCIAAGNCAVIKVPSPKYSPASSETMARLLQKYMDPKFFRVVTGDRNMIAPLLEERWDLIFCTGSHHLGKIVATAAGRHLTPTVLELGGQNPCIVEQSASIELASKRIVWGSMMNSGQTCLRPEYVLVHEQIADQFVAAVKQKVDQFYSKDPQSSEWFGRIATPWACDRIDSILTQDKAHVVHGGVVVKEDKFVAPTILYYEDLSTFAASAAAKEEIFGPLMAVVKYSDLDPVLDYINHNEKPLALYLFGNDKATREYVLTHTSSGSACINDVVMQVVNGALPFGGVGYSGMGCYHGRHSFNAFSHLKAVMVKPNLNILDVPIRYPPYTAFKAAALPAIQAPRPAWLSNMPRRMAVAAAPLGILGMLWQSRG